MIFRFMEKYRVPILIAVLAGLVFFGLAVSFGSGGGREDLEETYVTVKAPGGEEITVTRGEYEVRRAALGSNPGTSPEDRAGAAVAASIRQGLAANSGLNVSQDEVEKVIRDTIGEAIEAQNEGKFDRDSYTEFVNRQFRMTPKGFEETLGRDLRLVKYFREVQRVNSVIDPEAVLEATKSAFTRYKMKGVFFDTKAFEAQATLEADENGNLSAEDEKRLATWWSELSDLQKRRYNTKGAVVSAEVVGFTFAGKSDEDLATDFARPHPLADNKTLADITAAYTPSDDDKAKMKLRLDRTREAYGVEADTPLEDAWAAKEERLVREWKILRLIKKLDIDAKVKEQAGEEVDLEALAKANGLNYFKYTNIGLNDLRGEESEYPGNYAGFLRNATPNKLVNFSIAIGENQPGFFVGPADEIGKHASVWRLIDKDLSPIPSLLDAKDQAVEAFAKEEALRLRDEAIDAFNERMDSWLEAKPEVAAVAAPARAEAETKIAERTKDLDAEADKDKIASITEEEKAAAEAKIDVEKDKYRREAFEAALADPGPGVVVEEGYFLPAETRGEKIVDQKEGTLEEKARSYLRRGFDSLQDDRRSDRVVEPGTVSDFVDARFYPGVRGRAMLVEKRQPTMEEIQLHPSWLRSAEQGLIAEMMQRSRSGQTKTMWDWSVIKANDSFKIDATKMMEDIEEEETRIRETEEMLEKKRLEREKQKELKKAAEDLGIGVGAPAGNNPLAPGRSGN
jgi:SurA-like protein